MGDADSSIPTFLDKIIEFPENKSFELLQPLTDFKHCHDGTPFEARIVFTCKQVGSSIEQHAENEFIIKVKVQAPSEALGSQTPPAPGPSTTTAAEIKVLEIFRDARLTSAPHLVSWKRAVQGPNGILPGGYVTYTIMTKMPGQALFKLNYWALPEAEVDEIRKEFLKALRSIYALGIEPIDRGLRNVLWERETKKCSIIDFELWRETAASVSDEKNEMQRWGLVSRPPSRDWWAEWNTQGR